MFFKKNEKKIALKKEIREKRAEIKALGDLSRKWISSFMKETDPAMAFAQMVVIRQQATRISNERYSLILMEKEYKLL